MIDNVMGAYISPIELYEKLKTRQKITLLDVRDPEEFSDWALYESLNIPLKDFHKRLNKFSPKSEIVTICNYGDSSENAASILNSAGYRACSLDGGLKEWNGVYDIVPIEEKRTTTKVFQYKRLGKGCLSYIIVSPETSEAIIIDPTHHLDVYLSFLETNHLSPVAVLDTHIHADHVSGGKALAVKLSIPYLLPKRSNVAFAFCSIEDELASIISLPVRVIHTPGHTPESITLLIDDVFLFTGDALFLDATGRAEAERNNVSHQKKLYASIVDKLFTLHEHLMVMPGHTAQPMIPGPIRAATLRYVKLFNPIHEISDSEAFLEHIKKDIGPIPPNTTTIKAINISGSMSQEDLDELELGGNHCAAFIPKAS